MAGHRQWHVSGWAAILIAPVILPFVLIAKAFGLLEGKPADLTASDVAIYLDDFLQDRGKPFDWDDFTSIPLADPELDDIREQAAFVPLPIDASGRARLLSLLDKVRTLDEIR